MQKNRLKQVLLEQSEFSTKTSVVREELKTFKSKLDNPFVVIVTGIRRSGKSTLLNQLRQNTKDNYYINFDDERLFDFKIEDFETLYEVFIELFGKQDRFYFDEIQNILGWERFVRRLTDSGKKVLITGSNANLLSKELGTHLTGRYIQIELFPFSFFEFLSLKKLKLHKNDVFLRAKRVEIKKYFNQYLEQGGFPQYLKTQESDYLKLLHENILYRDILVRYGIRQEKSLKQIVHFLTSNISKEFSYNSLKTISMLKNTTTIGDYIFYLENAYFLFTLNRFDYSLKKQLVNPKKIYSIDTGLANQISFRFSEDRGKQLENIVFLQLKRENKKLYYHRAKKECDFLIKKRDRIVGAIQVCLSLDDIETKKREVDGIIDACKTYSLTEGLILTEDEEFNLIQQGITIKVIPIWKWLLRDHF